jgi:hypothetical protein
MPNTLAHFGIQTLASKAVDRTADIKWVAVGCILPDLPWITQRLISSLVPGIDPLSLRVYCLIQASLFFCLILSASIALLNRNAARVFLLLGGNSLAHLLLDGMQTKWANGVHLSAPFSWQLSQFQLFWPEDMITGVLTAGGLLIIAYYGWYERRKFLDLKRSVFPLLLSSLLLISYVLLPFMFFNDSFEADNHYVQTLQSKEQRSGKAIGFDRCRYDKSTATITVFTREKFKLISDQSIADGTISLLGIFTDNNTITASTVHQHAATRDFYSYVGLSILLVLWATALLSGKIKIT